MKKLMAIVLLALSCWVVSPDVADASMAGALAGKVASGLDEAMKTVKSLWARGASYTDEVGKVASHYGDDVVRLLEKYGDDASRLSSRNRQKLLRLEGQVDDDLLRQAVRQGDSGVEQLYRVVVEGKGVPKGFLGRTWDTVKIISSRAVTAFVAFLGGFGLGFFFDLLGDLPPVVQWGLKIALYGFLVLLAFRTLQWVVAILWLTLGPLFRFLRGPAREVREEQAQPTAALPEREGLPPRAFSIVRRQGHFWWYIVTMTLLAILYCLAFFRTGALIRGLNPVLPVVQEETSQLSGTGEIQAAQETPEERYAKVRADLESDWSRQVARVSAELKDLVSERLQESYGKWVSADRMDRFCDDYFGYVQGWKFTFLGIQDLLEKGSPHFRAEIDRMALADLLFDMEDDQNNLYLEIEDRLAAENREFTQKVAQRFQEEFSEEEIASLKERMEFGSLSVLPTEFMAIARTGGGIVDFYFSERIATRILDAIVGRLGEQAGSRATAALAGAAGARTASVCAGGLAKFALGFSIGIVIDYAITRGVRMATEADFRAEFTEALDECRKELVAQWEEGLDSVLRKNS